MKLGRWLLGKMNGLAARGDLPRHAPVSPVLIGETIETPHALQRRGASEHAPLAPDAATHLGPYAPLIHAIRDELEHFVASYLRLHLAIADRDRYVLTSIDVRALGPGDEELLQRFVREFKPEQVKHYLAKEVIGALPNASAIDLTQFAGLNADRDDEEDDGGYSELLAELRSAKPETTARPFEVSLIGRWSELPANGAHARRGVPATPVAGRSVELAIEDANGSRHLTLPAVVPGRRYAIGKGDGCAIAVEGRYASRRHCEVWYDRGTWWVTDAGSTNGVRVERGGGVLGRSAGGPNLSADAAAVEVTAGACIVLSSHGEGSAADYPRVALDVARDDAAVTPVAPAATALATPSTPIAAARAETAALAISAQLASGVRNVDLRADALPFSIGRSRRRNLVIDWDHEGVSGHHLDITAIDDEGVTLVVHGDNGITIGGASHPPGTRLRWKPGEAMALGHVVGREPECRLVLTRRT
jgi:hypothetical protein